MNKQYAVLILAAGMIVLVTVPGWKFGGPRETSRAPKSVIERGRYLSVLGGCNDCHSPKIMTPMGPVPDTTRLLSGSPSGETVPPLPAGVITPAGWGGITTNDMTIWTGPWGTSFAKNLTPDVATGIGSWTEAMFVKAMRTGKDMGEGRDILPPMPWPGMARMSDADLKALFTYLKSLPPVSNAVPDPVPPAGSPAPEKH